MQHTQTYSLNLIETSDTFSPAPINENTQKLEDIITAGTSAEAQARADAVTALDARVTALEAHKVAAGTFVGTGDSAIQTINLGFTPIAVIAQPMANYPYLSVQARAVGVTSVDGGFQVTGNYLNSKGSTCSFFAIC